MNRPEAGSAAVRLVGAFFAATAAGNAVGTIRTATGFLEWMRDGAWLAPRLLRRLVPVAPAVVAAVFEAVRRAASSPPRDR